MRLGTCLQVATILERGQARQGGICDNNEGDLFPHKSMRWRDALRAFPIGPNAAFERQTVLAQVLTR